MKKLLYAMLISGLIFSFYSCDKDDDDGDGGGTNLANLDTTASKDLVAESAATLVKEMGDLVKSPAVKAAAYLMSEIEDIPFKKSIAISPLAILADFNNGKATVADMFVYLRTINADPITDIEQEYKDSIAATYTYNATKNDFDKTASDNLIVKFPTSATSGNNATFTVSSYDWITSSTIDEEVPEKIEAKLTIDSKDEVTISFEASYTDGLPTSIASSFTISGYTMKVDFTDENRTKATAEYSFTNGTTELIKFSADVSGSYSEANITSNTKYYKETCTFDETSYEHICVEEVTTADDPEGWEEVDMANIIASANATFILMDLKIAGTIKAKEFITAMEAIESDWDDTDAEDKANAEAETKAATDNITLTLSSKAGAKIGDVSFSVFEDSYDSEDCQWNETTYEYECLPIVETDYDTEPEFVFADGSILNPDVFFDKVGFSTLIAEINNITKNINTEYGEYMDEEIETITDIDDLFPEEEEREEYTK